VAIISRGSYIAPGKKPEGTERRLHLLIEGSSEMQVRQVKMEIVRLLEEETMRIGASGGGGSFGRYSVT
jgi:ATP-dependent RNA helicase DDX46/PRP5